MCIGKFRFAPCSKGLIFFSLCAQIALFTLTSMAPRAAIASAILAGYNQPPGIDSGENLQFEETIGPRPPIRITDIPAMTAALVSELIAWIGASTDYDITRTLSQPPGISFGTIGETILYEGEDIIIDSRMKALYDLKGRHIFLVSPWNSADLNDRSALLHELIHDVQYLNRGWNCIGEPEWEAYKLQEKWLNERGVDPEYNWLLIFFTSKCPRDIHPD